MPVITEIILEGNCTIRYGNGLWNCLRDVPEADAKVLRAGQSDQDLQTRTEVRLT